jgi:TPR repeat protein
MKVFALVAILVAAGLLMGREAYFYFAVFRPGIAKMIDAAERGDPAMQTELGMLYQAGGVPRRVSERPALFIHVPPDGSKAFYWYQRAATQGYAKGEKFLSLAYAGGIGVQRNDPEVVRWMARAANHGDPSAKMMYGRMFDKGYNGVSRDEVQAVKWYRAAAEAGQVQAQRLLADCYSSGRGVQRDDAQAIAWYAQAAKQGDAEAQSRVRELEARGQGAY